LRLLTGTQIGLCLLTSEFGRTGKSTAQIAGGIAMFFLGKLGALFLTGGFGMMRIATDLRRF
jgi:hypothetical protein